MSPTVLPTGPREAGLTGRHVLLAMLSFFGVVFAVNGVMLYKALSTHSGLVAQEPYRKGLAYNERIAADERQTALGWQAAVDVTTAGRIALTITAADGGAVGGLAASATIGRPTSNRHDVRARLREQSPGAYVAEAGPLEAGAWVVDIEVSKAEGESAPVFRIRRRLWLKP